jgi:hypothetical protein
LSGYANTLSPRNETAFISAKQTFSKAHTVMLRFHKIYFLLTLLLLLIEILIAAFAHDQFIRPYVGDFLVVIFLYCLLRSFFKTSYLTVALAVLLFSYVVEVSQYFHLINHLGLQHSRLAHLILGSGFEWLDLVAYTLGIALVLWVERIQAIRNVTPLA